MPQFPRSQRTVNAQQSPLPYSTGGGYAAPGAALQQLGTQISSFAGKLQAEQEKADEFAFKTGLQKFANEQEQKYTSYRDTIDGDAGNFPTDVLKGFDKDWSKFQEGIPPQLRQKAELYKERFRGDYQRRSYGDQQRIRSRWYVAQGTDLFAKTILPRVTGDIRSVESGLTATENIIGSMSGVPPQVANKLREQAAQQIFKKWLQAAGPDAAPAAREIIERYKATRIGPTPGSARAAQEGERTPQTAPVPAGGMPDYRGQRGPAPIRYNNPSGQYPGPSARKFGAVGTEIIGGGHKIAVFPTAVHGGAAHFDLLSRAYAGKTIAALVRKWGGGNSPTAYANNVSRQLGVSPGTVVTRQMLQDPAFAIPFAKAMARHETGREYPMSDDQWRQAHAMAFGGAAPTPAAQPITTQDHFHRLIIENAEKIERGETLAQRRSEVDARRKERAIHDATTREGYEMLFDKKLTREWVEANKDNLPTGTYVTFMKAVVPQGRTTDPQVFSHLLERADERPKDIMEEAAQAYARGDLNYDSYRVIASKARKALDPNGQSSAPPWVREQRSIIKQQLRPGRGASQAQYEAYGKALEAYDNYVDRQGAEIDRKALREWSSGLVEQTKKGLVSANKTALPMPRFSQVGRTAMTVEEIDATVERTVRAYRAGKLSKDEFIAEAKALKQWRGVLEDQAGTEGKTIAPPQPKAEGAGRFVVPGFGARSEVKGTSETVPDQVTQEPIDGAAAVQWERYGVRYDPRNTGSGNVEGGSSGEWTNPLDGMRNVPFADSVALWSAWSDLYKLRDAVFGSKRDVPMFAGEDEAAAGAEIERMLRGEGPPPEQIAADLAARADKYDWHTNVERNPVVALARAYGWGKGTLQIIAQVFRNSIMGRAKSDHPAGRIKVLEDPRSARLMAIEAEDGMHTDSDLIKMHNLFIDAMEALGEQQDQAPEE